MPIAIVVLAVAAVIIIYAISQYNRLVTLRNRFKNSFSQIDVQLKRRYDLIPNLVETAKGYMKHERETLEAVITARSQAITAEQKLSEAPGNAALMQSLSGAEAALGSAMGKFLALAESYPELKADKAMTSLMEELTATENKVGFSRQAFNDSVTMYNTALETFPSNLIAGAMGFTPAQLLELDEPEARKPVKVSF